MNLPLRLTREQILSFRRCIGGLDMRLPYGDDSLRLAAWAGLQDSMPRAALLGMQPQHDAPYYVGFEAAGQHIGLVPGGASQGMTAPVPYWHVPDIEAKLAEVTAAGATVKDPPRDVGGGRLVATVTDPDGNVLGLLQDR